MRRIGDLLQHGRSETATTTHRRSWKKNIQSNATYRAGEACDRHSQTASACRDRRATWASCCWASADRRRCGWGLGGSPLMTALTRSSWTGGTGPRQIGPAGSAAPRWPSRGVFYQSILVSRHCFVQTAPSDSASAASVASVTSVRCKAAGQPCPETPGR